MNETTNAINDQDIYDEAAAVAIEEMDLPESIEAEVEDDEQVELTLEAIVDQILDASKLTEFTMYQVAKVLNATLEAIDATKGFDEQGEPLAYRVRPQMVYQYNKNKLVAKSASTGKGIQLTGPATLAQARAFIIRFSAKFVK
jgi:hypothetical protein